MQSRFEKKRKQQIDIEYLKKSYLFIYHNYFI